MRRAPRDRRPFNLWAGLLEGDTYGGSPSDPNFGQNLNQNQDAKRRKESLKIVLRFFPGGSPGHPESGPGPSPSTLEQRKNICDPTGAKKSRKSHESRPKVGPKRPSCDPSGTPKSTKNEPGTENVRSETASEAILFDVVRRCRSQSISRSILGRSKP